MLNDFKWLFVLVLCAADMILLPLVLLCILGHWVAYVIPIIPVVFFGLREERRAHRARMNPYKYKVPSQETIDEYVEMVREKD